MISSTLGSFFTSSVFAAFFSVSFFAAASGASAFWAFHRARIAASNFFSKSTSFLSGPTRASLFPNKTSPILSISAMVAADAVMISLICFKFSFAVTSNGLKNSSPFSWPKYARALLAMRIMALNISIIPESFAFIVALIPSQTTKTVVPNPTNDFAIKPTTGTVTRPHPSASFPNCSKTGPYTFRSCTSEKAI